MQDNQTAPLSSRDYLEQMRQRRTQQSTQQPAQPAPQPQSQMEPQPQTVPPAQAAPRPQPQMQPQPESQPNPLEPQPQVAAPQPQQLSDPNEQAIPASAFLESQMFPGQFNPIPEETILEWKAPNRPYKKRNRQYYTTVAAIVFLVSLILFFAGQFLPIAVVISVGFISYALSAVPPVEVTNKITTWGIRIEKQIFYWEELGRYWFETKLKQTVLYIETARFPNRITLLPGNITQQQLDQLLSEVLIKQKPEPTTYDKAAQWLQEKFPLDIS